MDKPSKHFTISAGMARQKDITRTFDAAVLIETERAYYTSTATGPRTRKGAVPVAPGD